MTEERNNAAFECTAPMCSMIPTHKLKNGNGQYCYMHAQNFHHDELLVLSTMPDNVPDRSIAMSHNGGKRQMLPYSLTEIPLEGLRRIGTVFCEGHIKYDRGNWRKFAGDRIMRLEAANHALRHLLLHIHQLETGEDLTGEDDLAKVGWYVVTECEIQRLEKRDAEKKS